MFANRKDVRLLDVANPRNNSTIIIDEVEEAAAVDYFYADNAIFWTDVGLEMIKMMYLNGSQVGVHFLGHLDTFSKL